MLKRNLTPMSDAKVLCETPTPGKKPTRILKWKYDMVRLAILKAVPKSGEGLLFKELSLNVENRLTPEQKQKLGSIGWYTTCVKLDLETKGEIRRLPNSSPQRLVRIG